MELKDTLSEYGLSKKEIEVYLALLKTGTAGVTRISELTNLPKSTCYDILRSLGSKGLCTSITKEGIQQFDTSDPSILIANLKEKEKKMQEVIPKLKEMRKLIIEKPKAGLYVGKQGLKTVFDEVINTKKEYLVLGNHTKFAKFFEWFSDQFILRRTKAKIPCRYIAEDSVISKNVKKKDRKWLRETRINKIMNNQEAECYIFGNKVAFVVFSQEEPMAFLIENKEIAKLQRVLFDSVWETKE